MCYRNPFAVSYGLIVKTHTNRVMLIQRKVPYCIQNFYIFLSKLGIEHDTHDPNPFHKVKEVFEKDHLPHLTLNDQTDYKCFQNGVVFEDMYDYPHGQLLPTKGSKTTRFHCFLNAYREFREETGFRFTFTKEDVLRYPLVKIAFRGCDEHEYVQYYFLVNNVKWLRRYRYFDSLPEPFVSTARIRNWKDDRLVYKSVLASIEEAIRFLELQQCIKQDFKHIVLKQWVCSKHGHEKNWRCPTCRQMEL